MTDENIVGAILVVVVVAAVVFALGWRMGRDDVCEDACDQNNFEMFQWGAGCWCKTSTGSAVRVIRDRSME